MHSSPKNGVTLAISNKKVNRNKTSVCIATNFSLSGQSSISWVSPAPREIYSLENNFHIYVVVQFYPWFKFYFPLFQTHYPTLQYPKTKEKKIWTKDKIEPQHLQATCSKNKIWWSLIREVWKACDVSAAD